jgi:hypothetical protein
MQCFFLQCNNLHVSVKIMKWMVKLYKIGQFFVNVNIYSEDCYNEYAISVQPN